MFNVQDNLNRVCECLMFKTIWTVFVILGSDRSLMDHDLSLSVQSIFGAQNYSLKNNLKIFIKLSHARSLNKNRRSLKYFAFCGIFQNNTMQYYHCSASLISLVLSHYSPIWPTLSSSCFRNSSTGGTRSSGSTTEKTWWTYTYSNNVIDTMDNGYNSGLDETNRRLLTLLYK